MMTSLPSSVIAPSTSRYVEMGCPKDTAQRRLCPTVTYSFTAKSSFVCVPTPHPSQAMQNNVSNGNKNLLREENVECDSEREILAPSFEQADSLKKTVEISVCETPQACKQGCVENSPSNENLHTKEANSGELCAHFAKEVQLSRVVEAGNKIHSIWDINTWVFAANRSSPCTKSGLTPHACEKQTRLDSKLRGKSDKKAKKDNCFAKGGCGCVNETLTQIPADVAASSPPPRETDSTPVLSQASPTTISSVSKSQPEPLSSVSESRLAPGQKSDNHRHCHNDGASCVSAAKNSSEDRRDCSKACDGDVRDDSTEQQGQDQRAEDIARYRMLLVENRRLKKRQMCRKCRVKEANMTLLPCGHLAYCKDCASAMTECGLCRRVILADVVTFLC